MSDFGGGGGGGGDRVEIDVDLNTAPAERDADQLFQHLIQRAKELQSLFRAEGKKASKALVDELSNIKGASAFHQLLEQSEKDLALLSRAAKEASAAISNIDKAAGPGRKLHAEFQQIRDDLKAIKGDIQDSLGTKSINLPTENLTPFDKQAQSLAKAQLAAEGFNKAIKLGIPKDFALQFSSGEKAIRAWTIAQANAVKENARFAKSAVDSGTAIQKTSNPIKAFANILDKADTGLKGMGLSLRGVSVLLGAGLATGVAGAVRVVEKISKDIADFVGSELELQRQTQLTFGDMTANVTAFAESTAHDFGVSRDEALKLQNSFASFGRTIGIGGDTSVHFAQALTLISGALAQTQPGFKGSEDAAKTLEEALRGDVSALEALGVPIQKIAALSEKTFRKLPDELTPAEAAFVGLHATALSAADAVGEFGLKKASGLQQFKDFFKGLAADGPDAAQAIGVVGDEMAKLVDNAGKIPEADFVLLSEQIKNLPTSKLKELRDRLELLPQTKQVRELEAEIGALSRARHRDRDAILEQAGATQTSTEVHKQNLEIFKASSQAQNQFLDLTVALTRAIEDGNERVTQAQLNLQRAIEDAGKRSRDVAKKNKDALEDAAHAVDQAEQRLSDARQDRAFKDAQAADRTAQAIIRAQRANRTAEENLQDFIRESGRRIADLKEKIRRLQEESRDTLRDVQVQIINARLRGQNELAGQASRQVAALFRDSQGGSLEQLRDAQRDLQREQEDDAIKLSRLHRDVTETRIDGIHDVKQAQKEQAQAEIESARQVRDAENAVTEAKTRQGRAIRDATDALTDLAKENSRAIQDANKALRDAQKERDRSIADASKALERFATSMGLVVVDMAQILNQLGLLDKKTLEFIQLMQAQQTLTEQGGFNFRFAAGGDVPAGVPSIWNETSANPHGELLITPSGGTIISHDHFMRLLRALEQRGSGSGMLINVNQVREDPVATAWKVGRQVMKVL